MILEFQRYGRNKETTVDSSYISGGEYRRKFDSIIDNAAVSRILYSKAKELGCNKIALGHHFNDVIETTVMAMFYGAQLQAMLPKLHSSNFGDGTDPPDVLHP